MRSVLADAARAPMPPADPDSTLPVPRRPGVAATVAQAVLLGALGGAFVGAVDALRVFAGEEPRYPQWAAGVALVGVLGTGALGALLGVPALPR